jgi:hypothetical protein
MRRGQKTKTKIDSEMAPGKSRADEVTNTLPDISDVKNVMINDMNTETPATVMHFLSGFLSP